jgi:large subunit ribosomal protein L29
MKASELRKLERDELEGRIGELRKDCFTLRIKYSTGQLEGMTSLRTARRNLARALTVHREGVQQEGQSQ